MVDLPDPVCGPGDVSAASRRARPAARTRTAGTCAQAAGRARARAGRRGRRGRRGRVGGGGRAIAVAILHHHAACGACRRVRVGPRDAVPRSSARPALDPGGFAEYVRVSRRSSSASCSRSTGLDPVVATCTRAARVRAARAGPRRGWRRATELLIVGAGASGLLHLAAALAHGVERVRVVEPRADRRSVAVGWGAERARRRAGRRRRRHDADPARSPRRPPRSARAGGCARTRRRSRGRRRGRRRRDLPARADRHVIVVGRRGRHARGARAAAVGRVRTDELIARRFAARGDGAALAAQRAASR